MPQIVSTHRTRTQAQSLLADLNRVAPRLHAVRVLDHAMAVAHDTLRCPEDDLDHLSVVLRQTAATLSQAIHVSAHAVARFDGEHLLGPLQRLEWHFPGPRDNDALALPVAAPLQLGTPDHLRAALFMTLAGPHSVPLLLPRSAASGLVSAQVRRDERETLVSLTADLQTHGLNVTEERVTAFTRFARSDFQTRTLRVAGAFLHAYRERGALDADAAWALSEGL